MADRKSRLPEGPQTGVSRRRTRAKRTPISRRRFWTVALITAAVVIAIPVIAGYLGYYFAVVRPSHQTIVRVNDRAFDLAYYVKQLRAIKRGTEQLGSKFEAATEPFRLVEVIQENEIIRQAAPSLGVTVPKEEVDREIESRLSKPPLSLLVPQSADQPRDDPQFQRDLKEAIRQWTTVLGLSAEEYRENVASDLRRQKIRELLGISVPTVSDQVRFSMIKVDRTNQENQANQQLIDQVTKTLAGGADFGKTAQDLSADEESALRNGDVGWVPLRVVPDLDDLLFGLPEDTIAPPVKAPEGFYLVRIEQRLGDRARLRAILVATEEGLSLVSRRVTTGRESFEAVAREVSLDPALRESGGDLGFLSEGARGGTFDEIIRGIDIGKVIGPRNTSDAAFWIKVTDRAKNREIEEKSRDALKTRALEDWLKKQQSVYLVHRTFNSDIYAAALEEIRSREEQATRRQQQKQPSQPLLPGG